MPRLDPVARDDADPVVREHYRLVFGDRDPVAEPGTATGTPGNWWTIYAHSPAVFAHATAHFGMSGILTDAPPSTTIAPAIREMAILRTGYLVESQFVFSQHAKAARRAGLSEAKIAGVRDWAVSAAFDEGDRAILTYVDALVLQRGRLSDAAFDALRDILSPRDIVELSHHVMAYAGYGAISRALRLEYDDVDDRVVEIPIPAAEDR